LNLKPADFTVMRDGRRLDTAVCRHCIDHANVVANGRQKQSIFKRRQSL